jgi:hypothetical protein
MLDQRVHRGGWTHAGPRSEHGKARPRGPTEAYTVRYVVPVLEPVPGSRTGSADGARNAASVVRQKSLSFDCHSGLDPESSLSGLDSRSPLKACGDKLRGNDGSEMNVKKR